MKQIILIHGGDSFNTYEEYLDSLKNWKVAKKYFQPHYDWKDRFEDKLGKDFELLQPRMPNKQNAKYAEWKIWFEKMFPFLEDEVILIGHSLGGMFLAKYLAENKFPKKIQQLHLVSAPHNQAADIGDFELPNDLSKIEEQAEKIYLYHSKDDEVVPISELDVFKKALPKAEALTFEDRGHFKQPEFPELVALITK